MIRGKPNNRFNATKLLECLSVNFNEANFFNIVFLNLEINNLDNGK